MNPLFFFVVMPKAIGRLKIWQWVKIDANWGTPQRVGEYL